MHAGIPALQEHPILCVDHCYGSIALSPDRKALAIFRPDPLLSLSSQLARPAMIDLHIPVQRPEMYEYTAQPSITAMVYSGKGHPGEASAFCTLGMAVLFVWLHCKTCHGPGTILCAGSLSLSVLQHC